MATNKPRPNAGAATTLIPDEELQDRRMQRDMDRHQGDVFLPMGKLMNNHLNYVRQKERKQKK